MKVKFVVLLFAVVFSAKAFNPFEGIYPILQKVKCRPITYCKETFLEAYKKSGNSAGDRNMNEATTQIYLFTRNNKLQPECLNKCGTTLPSNTHFNPENRTIIIVPGHNSGYNTVAFISEMKTQLLVRGSYNVIVFDWAWGNGIDLYDTGINTEVVGKQLAFFIENLIAYTSISADQIYMIGHSFGSHAAGIAGQRFYANTGTKVGRITGLSPFGPSYRGADPDRKLDATDAKLVDVIQTGQGPCLPSGFSTTDKSGHADFYVNGGGHQWSCHFDMFTAILKGDFLIGFVYIVPGVCSYIQSTRYFIASINPCHCQFVGVECRNYGEFTSGLCRSCGADGSKCAVMGFDFDNYPHGTGNHSYYLDTELFCPYCKKGDINLQGFPNSTAAGLHCFTP